MPKIRVPAGTDSVTGKKIKVEQTSISYDNDGLPAVLTFWVRFYESDGNTEVTPSGSYIAKRSLTAYEDRFEFNGWMDPISKLFVDPAEPGAVTVKSYFETKLVTSYPGVNQNDTLWKFEEHVLKEIVNVLQINGILPA